jgi:uncharacterized lipoprotein YajG
MQMHHAIPSVATHGTPTDSYAMKKLFAIAPFFFLAACEMPVSTPTSPRGPALPAITDDTCNANQYGSLIGQDVTALERVMILDLVRVIRPNQAVTLDFRPERINFKVGPAGAITSINCG